MAMRAVTACWRRTEVRVSSAQHIAQLVADAAIETSIVGDERVQVGPDVVIDSRVATPGSLFIGLPGERVDGVDLAATAAERGAAAAIVGHDVEAPLTRIVVPDAAEALAGLARALVAEEAGRGMTILAITGSSGKTSTKDLLAQVLERFGPTVSPAGNHNNEIGVPLTACGVDASTRFLVAEMGARGIGHIRQLCEVVPPRVAAVLNVGTAHLGEFGSREAIAQAKGEILQALPADGWAVLNDDDELIAAMGERTDARIARWSASGRPRGEAELVVWAEDIVLDALQRGSFTLHAVRQGVHGRVPVRLGLIGTHQVPNAVAAATMAMAAGAPLLGVGEALGAARTRSPLRMELVEGPGGAAIINDCYNANPDSMAVALRTVAAMGEARKAEIPGARLVAVIGDMAELGEEAEKLHEAAGALAAALGYDEIIAVGEQARAIVAGARGPGGHGAASPGAGGIARVADKEDVAESLELGPGDVVLVKASRVLALEDVTSRLIGRDEEGTAR
ncbi:UDP-N-acetylmuramoyl-tripeptide--D-alanyl-D-alanine ligase [Propionibacterium australiense]|uniref:UDP-N-acetylmuramoyl-tripeptide--D-alanyl-D-alanine ligase n=1 Tax=Propionibacterium australiense TaxID=119981 RepID=A0A8B3FN33_9ACTN|nr:UDP-N-acetylmuramoyl-tripeptide--D-alanyl-D-alanine ligase [Propionibacterium australiense]